MNPVLLLFIAGTARAFPLERRDVAARHVSVGALVGIVIGIVLVIALAAFLAWFLVRRYVVRKDRNARIAAEKSAAAFPGTPTSARSILRVGSPASLPERQLGPISPPSPLSPRVPRSPLRPTLRTDTEVVW